MLTKAYLSTTNTGWSPTLNLEKGARGLGNAMIACLSCDDLEKVSRMMISTPGTRERLEKTEDK